MIGKPECDLSNTGREFLDLDAEELIDVDLDEVVYVERQLARSRRCRPQYVQLQFAQRAIGYDQEVATAARGIEKCQRAQFLMKLEQPIAVVFDALELGAQLIQKQRFDELFNVLFAGVVRT